MHKSCMRLMRNLSIVACFSVVNKCLGFLFHVAYGNPRDPWEMVMQWRGQWASLIVLRFRVQAPFFRLLLRRAFPPFPFPNITELFLISLSSTRPNVYALSSVPLHQRLIAVLAIVLEDTNVESVIGGCTASAPRDGGLQAGTHRHAACKKQGSRGGVSPSTRCAVGDDLVAPCASTPTLESPPPSHIAQDHGGSR
ncbi:hypothetical protein B0H13DRAFT_2386686 [Mycena leptocephala]|nr:hypothetical protein B0H13DRAFT_2386686 [Mycena leptocephala]